MGLATVNSLTIGDLANNISINYLVLNLKWCNIRNGVEDLASSSFQNPKRKRKNSVRKSERRTKVKPPFRTHNQRPHGRRRRRADGGTERRTCSMCVRAQDACVGYALPNADIALLASFPSSRPRGFSCQVS